MQYQRIEQLLKEVLSITLEKPLVMSRAKKVQEAVGSILSTLFAEDCKSECVAPGLRTSEILLVDDDAFLRKAMAYLLNRAGYNVTQAANGREALTQIQQRPPDLVITDIAMPGGSGLELIGALRQRRPNLPVIAMSGDLDSETYLNTARLWGAKVLPKPFENWHVLGAVRALLEPPRQEAARP